MHYRILLIFAALMVMDVSVSHAQPLPANVQAFEDAHLYRELLTTTREGEVDDLINKWTQNRTNAYVELYIFVREDEPNERDMRPFDKFTGEFVSEVAVFFISVEEEDRKTLVFELIAIDKVEQTLRVWGSERWLRKLEFMLRTFVDDWDRRIDTLRKQQGRVAFSVNVQTVDRITRQVSNERFVFYVPRGLRNEPAYFRRFYRMSSDTERRNLMAGTYLFWAQYDDVIPTDVPAHQSALVIDRDVRAPLQILDPPR